MSSRASRLLAAVALLLAFAASSNANGALRGLLGTGTTAHEPPRAPDAALIDELAQPRPAGISGNRLLDVVDLQFAPVVPVALLLACWLSFAGARLRRGPQRFSAIERAPPSLV